MKKLYITLIALTLAVAMSVPVGMAGADPSSQVEDVQEFLDQYNLAVNPEVKTTVAEIASQHPGCVCQMAIAYASISHAGAAYVAGPTGATGTPVVISVGNGQYIATMI